MTFKIKNIYNERFEDRDDGLRVYNNGLATYKVTLDKSKNLWYIDSDDGTIPAPLRQKYFTNPRFAIVELKNHADRLPERQEVYRKIKESREIKEKKEV